MAARKDPLFSAYFLACYGSVSVLMCLRSNTSTHSWSYRIPDLHVVLRLSGISQETTGHSKTTRLSLGFCGCSEVVMEMKSEDRNENTEKVYLGGGASVYQFPKHQICRPLNREIGATDSENQIQVCLLCDNFKDMATTVCSRCCSSAN